ncbi:MAG: hypothetical protein DWB44_17070 [Chloroflexi bacterium]|nr:hypothetical protein [Chloroflexota bacterium]
MSVGSNVAIGVIDGVRVAVGARVAVSDATAAVVAVSVGSGVAVALGFRVAVGSSVKVAARVGDAAVVGVSLGSRVAVSVDVGRSVAVCTIRCSVDSASVAVLRGVRADVGSPVASSVLVAASVPPPSGDDVNVAGAGVSVGSAVAVTTVLSGSGDSGVTGGTCVTRTAVIVTSTAAVTLACSVASVETAAITVGSSADPPGLTTERITPKTTASAITPTATIAIKTSSPKSRCIGLVPRLWHEL